LKVKSKKNGIPQRLDRPGFIVGAEVPYAHNIRKRKGKG
jgi:hypothetical protein